MAINVSVQYNGGRLPDIILLSLCVTTLGNPFDTMKNFCPYSQCSHLNILLFFPPRVDAQNVYRGLHAFRVFLKQKNLLLTSLCDLRPSIASSTLIYLQVSTGVGSFLDYRYVEYIYLINQSIILLPLSQYIIY